MAFTQTGPNHAFAFASAIQPLLIDLWLNLSLPYFSALLRRKAALVRVEGDRGSFEL